MKSTPGKEKKTLFFQQILFTISRIAMLFTSKPQSYAIRALEKKRIILRPQMTEQSCIKHPRAIKMQL